MKCLTVAVAMLVPACAARETADPTATTTTTTATAAPTTTAADAPDVRLPLIAPGNGGAAAAAPGTLEVEGRCLYLRMENTRMLLLFSTRDTRWNRAAGALEVGNDTFRPGDRVVAGGGSPNGMPNDVTWLQPPDPSCLGDQLWVAHSITRERR